MTRNILDNEGRTLPIMEYFLSLQGEGFHTGLASFFIRIGGCDVGCHWCDVKESWNPEIHDVMPVDDLIKHIPKQVKTVVITGGEPTLYNLTYLTDTLHKLGKEIHLETSGAGNFTGNFDWICLSPKKNELPKDVFYQQADELKIIVFNKTDLVFAEQQSEKVMDKCHLYLQSEWSKRNTMMPEIIRYIESKPKWKLSLQAHKYIHIP